MLCLIIEMHQSTHKHYSAYLDQPKRDRIETTLITYTKKYYSFTKLGTATSQRSKPWLNSLNRQISTLLNCVSFHPSLENAMMINTQPHLSKRGNVYQWRPKAARFSIDIIEIELSLGPTEEFHKDEVHKVLTIGLMHKQANVSRHGRQSTLFAGVP